MIQIASAIVVGAIFCIVFNQMRKKKRKTIYVQSKEVSQEFMVETMEPIKDFEMIYFDEHRGLVQLNVKKDE